MFDLIEKLRQKPDGTKRRIAFLAAFFLSGFIFVIWLSVVYPDFRQQQSQENKVESLNPSPFSGFFETISGGFSGIGQQLNNIKEAVSSFSTNPAYYSATTTISTTTETSFATTSESFSTTTGY